MPIKLPDGLPAIDTLRSENIFVMNSSRASQQDIRPLKIAILNLMPIKETTETDLIRLLSNSPLQIDLKFMKLSSHTSKNTSIEHMEVFYVSFSELKNEKFDGLIITGAPVEQMDYEQVTYWKEVTEIMDWARDNVTSTLFICWAAQAALYHYYGIPKYPLAKKMSGVFSHTACQLRVPILRGFDDEFNAPHSRHSEVRRKDILSNPKLTLLSESEEAGVFMVSARGGRELFVTGHMEYSPGTLDAEYHRDIAKGMDVPVPSHYYRNDDPSQGYVDRWRSHANLLYSNWLNYYVYQETPYNLDEIHQNG